MRFLEKNLEDIIFETDPYLLADRGLIEFGKKMRQVNLGSHGVADLITFIRDRNRISITIYELKKGQIGVDTFLQAARYKRGVMEYLSKRDKWCSLILEFKIILIGSSISTDRGFDKLPMVVNGLYFHTYKYSFDGVMFYDHYSN